MTKRTGAELSPEASEALRQEIAGPGSDTPERRAMFARMDALEIRLKKEGYVFDDEALPSRSGTRR